MNLLQVVLDPEGHPLDPDGRALPFQAPNTQVKKLVLGLRPEHLRLHAEQGLKARIEMIEILGSEQLVHMRWGEQPLVLRCTVAETRSRPLSVGDAIVLGPYGQHPAHWFDAETGLRVDD